MSYILFGEPGSGSFCAEAALTEAGAAFTLVDLDLSKAEQLRPEHLARSPTGKVPALQLPSGHIITESAAILLTIAERHPDSGLLPRPGTDARASALRWIVFLSSEIYPMVEIVDYPQRFAEDLGAAARLKEAARERMRERFLILENNISGPWVLGDTFSAADFYAANLAPWFIGDEWRRAACPMVEAIRSGVAARAKVAAVWQRHFGGRTGQD